MPDFQDAFNIEFALGVKGLNPDLAFRIDVINLALLFTVFLIMMGSVAPLIVIIFILGWIGFRVG